MIPVTEIIDWQGITLSVTYTPWGRLPVSHLAIKVVAPVGGTLPITETGYRSYLFYDDIAPFGGPIARVAGVAANYAAIGAVLMGPF